MSGQRSGLSEQELRLLVHWDSPLLNVVVASIVARREAAAAAEAVEKALGPVEALIAEREATAVGPDPFLLTRDLRAAVARGRSEATS